MPKDWKESLSDETRSRCYFSSAFSLSGSRATSLGLLQSRRTDNMIPYRGTHPTSSCHTTPPSTPHLCHLKSNGVSISLVLPVMVMSHPCRAPSKPPASRKHLHGPHTSEACGYRCASGLGNARPSNSSITREGSSQSGHHAQGGKSERGRLIIVGMIMEVMIIAGIIIRSRWFWSSAGRMVGHRDIVEIRVPVNLQGNLTQKTPQGRQGARVSNSGEHLLWEQVKRRYWTNLYPLDFQYAGTARVLRIRSLSMRTEEAFRRIIQSDLEGDEAASLSIPGSTTSQGEGKARSGDKMWKHG